MDAWFKDFCFFASTKATATHPSNGTSCPAREGETDIKESHQTNKPTGKQQVREHGLKAQPRQSSLATYPPSLARDEATTAEHEHAYYSQ